MPVIATFPGPAVGKVGITDLDAAHRHGNAPRRARVCRVSTRQRDLRTAAEEAALYEGLRRGSLRAFRRLLAQHHGGMLRVAGWYTDDPERGAAVVRHAWMTALGGLTMFTWHTTFRAWLFGILVVHGRGEPAMAAPPPPVPAGPPAATPPTDWSHLPWSAAWSAQAWARLDTAVARLEPHQREAVRLRDVEQWSFDEAGDILGWTGAEMVALLHAGRAALVDHVARELALPPCLTCDEPATRPTALAEGALDEPERSDAATHAAGCPACACRTSRLAGVTALLAATATPHAAVPPDPRLVTAFRRWRSARQLHLWQRLGLGRLTA